MGNIEENDDFESLIKGLGGDDETDMSMVDEEFSLGDSEELPSFEASEDIEADALLNDAIDEFDSKMESSDISSDEPSLELSVEVGLDEASLEVPEEPSDVSPDEPSLELPVEADVDSSAEVSLEGSETEEEALEACVEKSLLEPEASSEESKLANEKTEVESPAAEAVFEETKEESVSAAPEASGEGEQDSVFPSMENWVKSLLTSKIDSIVAGVVSEISHETIEGRIFQELESILEKAVAEVVESQDFHDKCCSIAEERIAEGVSSNIKEWTSEAVNQKTSDMVTEEIEKFKEKLKAL